MTEQDTYKYDPTPKVIDPDAWKRLATNSLQSGRIIYGGAAGGGKSHWLRMAAVIRGGQTRRYKDE